LVQCQSVRVIDFRTMRTGIAAPATGEDHRHTRAHLKKVEPLLRLRREHARAGDKVRVRLLGAAPHAALQLVERRYAEPGRRTAGRTRFTRELCTKHAQHRPHR
jgi:hypothetical protein